jgi:hypothetical protein
MGYDMFGLFKKRNKRVNSSNTKQNKASTAQNEQLMDSKRNIRDRVGAQERRLRHRRQQHDRRQEIRFEFKNDRRSGKDRRRENNKSWSIKGEHD